MRISEWTSDVCSSDLSDCVARARGARPVLLLDEVAAHLDPSRRSALYERLTGQGGQAWLTGTAAALFDAMPGPVTPYRIAGGDPKRARAGKCGLVRVDPRIRPTIQRYIHNYSH